MNIGNTLVTYNIWREALQKTVIMRCLVCLYCFKLYLFFPEAADFSLTSNTTDLLNWYIFFFFFSAKHHRTRLQIQRLGLPKLHLQTLWGPDATWLHPILHEIWKAMSFDNHCFLGWGVHNTQVSAKSDLFGRWTYLPRTCWTGIYSRIICRNRIPYDYRTVLAEPAGIFFSFSLLERDGI